MSNPHDVDAAGPSLQQPDRGVKRPARRWRTVISDDDAQQLPGWYGVCGFDPRLPLLAEEVDPASGDMIGNFSQVAVLFY